MATALPTPITSEAAASGVVGAQTMGDSLFPDQASAVGATARAATLVARVLRARAGTHDPGVAIRYRWFVGARGVPGATAASYKVRSRDRGKRIRVATTAMKPGYVPVVRYSAYTARVRLP